MSHTIIEACTGCTACVKICPVAAITGERKSMHVIDTSVCVDCGACGKICPAKAILNETGELCGMVKRSLWLQPIVAESRCVSCRVCLQVCPTSVLALAEANPNRLRPRARLVDAKNCIGCAYCQVACPTAAIVMHQPETN